MIQFAECKFYKKIIFYIPKFKPYDFYVSSYIDYLFIVPFVLFGKYIKNRINGNDTQQKNVQNTVFIGNDYNKWMRSRHNYYLSNCPH